MTAAMYLLLLVALVCANLPFVTVRWFGLKRLPEILSFAATRIARFNCVEAYVFR